MLQQIWCWLLLIQAAKPSFGSLKKWCFNILHLMVALKRNRTQILVYISSYSKILFWIQIMNLVRTR